MGSSLWGSISKSKLANDFSNLKVVQILGVAVFSENIHCQVTSQEKQRNELWRACGTKEFPASFRLFNLRGDALDPMETAYTVGSVSDVVLIICEKDMFKIGSYKILVHAVTRNLSVKERKEKTIKNLVVAFMKDLYGSVKINHSLFKRISKDVI